MAATSPPSIPVRQTTKSMYKPISKLNGDQLPMLRRVKRPELSGRVTLYNHYTERVLDNALNVSFKQHEHKMETIRKEQAHIYKSLCRIQKLKRRVQKDEHEQRRQEIRNMFNRQRKRQMMRRVVAKFKENAIKRRAERMIQDAVDTTDEYEFKAPVLSAQQLLKYAGGLRRHTQPEVSGSNVSEDTSTTNSSNTRNDFKTDNDPKIKQSPNSTEENHHKLEHNERDNSKNVEGSFHQNQNSTKNSPHIIGKKNEQNAKPTHTPLEVIPEVTVTKANKTSRRGTSKCNSPATRHRKQTASLSSKSLPAMHQHDCQNQNHNVSEDAKSGQREMMPHPQSTATAFRQLKHSDQDEENHSSHDVLIDQVVRENTFGDEEFPGKITHRSVTSGLSGRSSEDGEIDENGHRPGTKKTRQRRRNMAKVIENERAEKAKARTRILDEEPFTRYLRKPQEKITAMYGLAKKAEFVPPSRKLRHEQDKLIRREQDKDIQSHINIERFFQEVFESKEPTSYRQPTVEKEEAPKKAVLSLAGVLSQMYTSTESVQGDKNSMENLRACQYLRVYNPYLKKIKKQQKDQEGSSWAVAERKLRAGFMALSFMK